jgi:hypothetical protein
MAAPKGFKKVETGTAGFWRPAKKGDCLQGVVGTARTVEGADGKPNTFFSIRITNVKSGPIATKSGKRVTPHMGMNVGAGGTVLRDFLTGREGREVFLEFTGMGEASKGHSAPRLFDCYDSEEAG